MKRIFFDHEPSARRSQLHELRIFCFLGESPVRMVSQEPRVMVFEKQITIIKIILSTNFDDLIIEISDIIILIIQISFRKNQSVVLLVASVVLPRVDTVNCQLSTVNCQLSPVNCPVISPSTKLAGLTSLPSRALRRKAQRGYECRL